MHARRNGGMNAGRDQLHQLPLGAAPSELTILPGPMLRRRLCALLEASAMTLATATPVGQLLVMPRTRVGCVSHCAPECHRYSTDVFLMWQTAVAHHRCSVCLTDGLCRPRAPPGPAAPLPAIARHRPTRAMLASARYGSQQLHMRMQETRPAGAASKFAGVCPFCCT